MSKKSEFQAAELLLDVTRTEYEYNENTLHALYNRTGITLAFVGIYIGVVWDLRVFLNSIYKLKINEVGILSAQGIVYIVCLGLAVITVFYLIRVLFTDNYTRLDLETGFEPSNTKMSKEEAAVFLLEAYRGICLANSKVIDRKHKFYEVSLKYFIASIVMLIVYGTISCIKIQ